jgi:hypothetical protein
VKPNYDDGKPPIVMKDIAYCNLDTITIVSKMLKSMKEYGYKITQGQIKQEQFNAKDFQVKKVHYFQQDNNEESTGDNISEEEYKDDFKKMKASKAQSAANNQNNNKNLEEEISAMLKRDVFIRRGRNNRIYYKAIAKDVF